MMTEPDMTFTRDGMVSLHPPTSPSYPASDRPDLANHEMSQQKFTDADFANDPFYKIGSGR
jgi:hypothetical protein